MVVADMRREQQAQKGRAGNLKMEGGESGH